MATRTVSRFGENVSGVDRETLASVAGVIGVTVSTVLMLQSMRVFVSYMVFVIDQSNRTTLATVAAGVFLASGLSWIFIRFLGIRTVIVVSTLLLALSRLSFQFWENPVARLWLGAIAVISWGWLFFAMVVTRRDQVALGVSLGLALDLGIRIAYKTVDLPWMPGVSADLFSVLLVGALLASVYFLNFSITTGGSRLMGSVSLL
ncbi:MAG TPA: hypothetical protein VHV31_16985, partial [Nitrolancea sp.]|nr:hypothetical protein [Nitrolancea sp.]